MKIDIPVFRVYQLQKNGENILIGEYKTKCDADTIIKQMEVINKFNNSSDNMMFMRNIVNFNHIDELFCDETKIIILMTIEDSKQEPYLTDVTKSKMIKSKL